MGEMIPVVVAVEDDLAEALVLAAITQSELPFSVESVLQKKGITYLRARADSLNRAAFGGTRVIMVADSDSDKCPVKLAQKWFPLGKHPNLAFRFSVRAAEAWILADAEGFCTYSGIKEVHLPTNPDEVADPKRTLVDIARRAKRSFRDLVVPAEKSVVPVGVGYNATLTNFVETRWSLERAAQRSLSIREFVSRIRKLAK
jgi:hypothetical protein